MPAIKLTNITKRWGRFFGVDNVSLDIDNNSFITLLGPSGCGKTTILRMIAGLETPTSGRIEIGDRVVFDSEKGINIPANKRKVGFLFQNYALWPNMTVYQNISFGLKNVKEEMPVIDSQAKQCCDLIHALKNGRKIKDLVDECRDKSGSLVEERVFVKLIDAFGLSMYSARDLFAMKIHESDDPQKAADVCRADMEKKFQDIENSYKAKGQGLNKNCEVVAGDKVVTAVRKLCAEEIDSRVRQVARIVKIGMFMDRYPAELSGGQQQRVAIARTLAPKPEVLFMDEPLSNLDAKLRLEMRYELQRLHVDTGSTFVYVTHDQMEAMTLATKICLVNNGVLQQYEAPLSVYNRPVNLFTADFVGNPSINFVEAKCTQGADGGIFAKIFDKMSARFVPSEKISLADWFAKRDAEQAEKESALAAKSGDKNFIEKSNKDEVFKYHIQKVDSEDFSIQDEPVLTNEDLVIGIRPEYIKVEDGGQIEATVYGVMPTGMESTLKLKVDEFLLTAVVFGSASYSMGQNVKLKVGGNNILLFDRKSGKLICTGSLEI